MKHFFKLILFLGIISSCTKIDDNSESVNITFAPRTCKNVYIVPGQKVNTGFADVDKNATIKAGSLVLAILTSNYDVSGLYARGYPSMQYASKDQFLDGHDAFIENQVVLLYKQSGVKSSSVNKDLSGIIVIEYRLDGVKNLKISTQDAVFFGVEPGGSLNNFFSILNFTPNLVISSTTKSILWPNKYLSIPSTLSEWLALKPLAQSAMKIQLNSIPTDLPKTVRFDIEMELMNGTTLLYRSFPITLVE